MPQASYSIALTITHDGEAAGSPERVARAAGAGREAALVSLLGHHHELRPGPDRRDVRRAECHLGRERQVQVVDELRVPVGPGVPGRDDGLDVAEEADHRDREEPCTDQRQDVRLGPSGPAGDQPGDRLSGGPGPAGQSRLAHRHEVSFRHLKRSYPLSPGHGTAAGSMAAAGGASVMASAARRRP